MAQSFAMSEIIMPELFLSLLTYQHHPYQCRDSRNINFIFMCGRRWFVSYSEPGRRPISNSSSIS